VTESPHSFLQVTSTSAIVDCVLLEDEVYISVGESPTLAPALTVNWVYLAGPVTVHPVTAAPPNRSPGNPVESDTAVVL